MKLVAPQPFTFEAGERAVLLLHGFTGNSADVRMLGRFYSQKDIRATLQFIKDMACRQRSSFIPAGRLVARCDKRLRIFKTNP